MFVIQRILELEGKLTLLEQNRVITPHPSFRLFCTTNTIGLGDTSGMYHGTQQINQGQMDRWNIVSTLNYLSEKQEIDIVSSKVKKFLKKYQKEKIALMINLANLTRIGFKNGDISTVMSPRTVITWAENTFYLHVRHLGHLSCLLSAKKWVYAPNFCAKNPIWIRPFFENK